MRKNKNRDNREWDMEKRDDWNNTRNQRNNSRGGRNSYRNNGSCDDDFQNDNRDYGRRNPGSYGNEHGGRSFRGGRGRGDRDRGDRDRGGRRGGRGYNDKRGGGRRYSDQHNPHKDFSN